jgi:hypothetical protein
MVEFWPMGNDPKRSLRHTFVELKLTKLGVAQLLSYKLKDWVRLVGIFAVFASLLFVGIDRLIR